MCQLQHAIPFVTDNWASGALLFTKLQPCVKLDSLTDANPIEYTESETGISLQLALLSALAASKVWLQSVF